MYDPILETLLKMRPHYSQYSRETHPAAHPAAQPHKPLIRMYTSPGFEFKYMLKYGSFISCFFKVLIFNSLNSHAPPQKGMLP